MEGTAVSEKPLVTTIERRHYQAAAETVVEWTPAKIRETFGEEDDTSLVLALLEKCEQLERELTVANVTIEKAAVFEADVAPHRTRAFKLLATTPRHLGKHFVQGLCDEIERLRGMH